MQRILVVRGGAVGDVILALPAMGALRQAFPNAHIDAMGDAKRLSVACHPAYANAILDAEQWGIHRLYAGRSRIPGKWAAYLDRCNLVLFYLPASGTTLIDNIKRHCRGEVIAWPPHPSTGLHVVDHLLKPLHRYVNSGTPRAPRVFPGARNQHAASEFWRSAGLPEQGVLAIHPGSGGRHKLWPMEGWRHLLEWAAKNGVPGILISGPAEQERGIGPLLKSLNPGWQALSNAPLLDLAAILNKCAAFAGHDSGVTHLAAAVGIPTLALFGPTDSQVWGPRSQRACVLQAAAQGPLRLDNMPVEAVIRTTRAMLDGSFQFTPSNSGHTRLRLPN